MDHKKISGLTALIILWMMGMVVPWALGQQTGSSGGTAGSTGTPKPPPVVVVPPPILTPSPDFRFPRQEFQPIFITGIVMREDGSQPPFGAIIEMDCGVSKTSEAIVNQNGYFSFQFGGGRRLSEIVPDASESRDQMPDDDLIYVNPNSSQYAIRMDSTLPLNLRLSGCDLRAQLPGYRSSALRLDGVKLGSVNNVGAIVIYPEAQVRGTIISATSLLAPKKAKSLLRQALKSVDKSRHEEAEKRLQSALEIYPNYAEAWMHLGTLYMNTGRSTDALSALQKSVAIDPLYVNPQVQLAWLLARERQWGEAVRIAEQALVLDPVTYPELYYLSALAHYNSLNADAAEKRAEQAKRRDTFHQYPQIHLILANIFEDRKNITASNEELMLYLKYAPNGAEAPKARQRLKDNLAKAQKQTPRNPTD